MYILLNRNKVCMHTSMRICAQNFLEKIMLFAYFLWGLRLEKEKEEK